MTRETISSRTCIAMEYMVSIKVPVEKVSLVLLIVHAKKPLQLDLYSNGIYGFYTSSTDKGSSGFTYSPRTETFSSSTCIAMEYMASIQVLVEKVSLAVLCIRSVQTQLEMSKEGEFVRNTPCLLRMKAKATDFN